VVYALSQSSPALGTLATLSCLANGIPFYPRVLVSLIKQKETEYFTISTDIELPFNPR
jgi:hypothetical protein